MEGTWDNILCCISLIGVGYVVRYAQEAIEEMEDERRQ